MTGFRNVAVHECRELDSGILDAIVRGRLGDLRDFARIVLERFRIGRAEPSPSYAAEGVDELGMPLERSAPVDRRIRAQERSSLPSPLSRSPLVRCRHCQPMLE